jgi:hypothetical protein
VKKESIKEETDRSESSSDRPIKQKDVKKEVKRESKIKSEPPIISTSKANNEMPSNPYTTRVKTETEEENEDVVRQSHKRNTSALSNLSLSPMSLLKEILNPSGNNDVPEETAFIIKLRTRRKKKEKRGKK